MGISIITINFKTFKRENKNINVLREISLHVRVVAINTS